VKEPVDLADRLSRFSERTVSLRPGQLYVVPHGVEHCPVADGDVAARLIEPAGTDE
jgi:mannose-6-phosphate isomerase-like protein (cupin superfamily)